MTTVARSGWGLLLLHVPIAAVIAQSPPRNSMVPIRATLSLVRCVKARDTACLRVKLSDTLPVPNGHWRARLGGAELDGPDVTGEVRTTPASLSPTFAAPVLQATALSRTELRGAVSLHVGGTEVARAPLQWRPPRLALAAFDGTADSLALSAPLRDALAVGADAPDIRPLLALVLLLTGIALVIFVPHFLWVDHRESEEDMARQVAAARALLSTQELEQLRGAAPREGKSRKPEEPTRDAFPLLRRPD